MNCECMSKVKADVLEMMKAKAGDDARIVSDSVAITMSDKGIASRLYIPLRIRGSKPGFKAESGKEVPVFVSYCPFCGKSAQPTKEGGEHV